MAGSGVDSRRPGSCAATSCVIAETAQVAAGVSIILLTFVTLLAYLLAGRVLAPLRRVTETTRALGESDLSSRVEVSGDDEVAELGRTFNGMLDRLEGAFSNQKELLRDAAHELQRPIATIRGHLELMGDDPADRQETVELVSEELDRMGLFVDDLLLLAETEHGDFLEMDELDLETFTEELLARVRGLADRDWALVATGGAELVADRRRVAQAVMNLARNAVAATLPGDRIELGSACDAGEARLWIASPADTAVDGALDADVSGRRRRAQGGRGRTGPVDCPDDRRGTRGQARGRHRARGRGHVHLRDPDRVLPARCPGLKR